MIFLFLFSPVLDMTKKNVGNCYPTAATVVLNVEAAEKSWTHIATMPQYIVCYSEKNGSRIFAFWSSQLIGSTFVTLKSDSSARHNDSLTSLFTHIHPIHTLYLLLTNWLYIVESQSSVVLCFSVSCSAFHSFTVFISTLILSRLPPFPTRSLIHVRRWWK